MIVVTGCES